jgi:pimeloyl-ACP methyl ester carboxylesterase
MSPGTGLVATGNDLPPSVAEALTSPPLGEEGMVEADGRRWHFLAWGHSTEPPLLLTHGVGSSARGWWRVGPALAAAGRRVVAIDMPGHGPAATWDVGHRFAETAVDVAGFIEHAGFRLGELAIVGHSWGAVVAAHLPQVGIRPATLVLLDPPWLTLEQLEALTLDPSERRYDSLDEARAAVSANNPDWSEGDVAAKAHALTEYDPAFVRAVLLGNGPYDAGMSALRHPDAQGVPVWLIRGEWSAGGLIPDEELPAIRAQVGPDQILTIAGGQHSPHRTHVEATVLAILRAIGH